MQPLEQQVDLVKRANGLYWESDRSVNQIAEEMDLSKGMLYEMIHPLRSGLPCPRCSADMEFSNRTARDRGLLICPSCSFEQDEDEVRTQLSEAAAAAPGGKLVVTPAPEASRERRRFTPDRLESDPLMFGAGLLLIAAGIWLFRGLRKK